MPLPWNAGILEYWINRKQTILIVEKSFKPIIPLLHHFYPVKLFSISPGPLFQLGLPARALQWQAGRSP